MFLVLKVNNTKLLASYPKTPVKSQFVMNTILNSDEIITQHLPVLQTPFILGRSLLLPCIQKNSLISLNIKSL